MQVTDCCSRSAGQQSSPRQDMGEAVAFGGTRQLAGVHSSPVDLGWDDPDPEFLQPLSYNWGSVLMSDRPSGCGWSLASTSVETATASHCRPAGSTGDGVIASLPLARITEAFLQPQSTASTPTRRTAEMRFGCQKKSSRPIYARVSSEKGNVGCCRCCRCIAISPRNSSLLRASLEATYPRPLTIIAG
jgi:hypothetical protein